MDPNAEVVLQLLSNDNAHADLTLSGQDNTSSDDTVILSSSREQELEKRNAEYMKSKARLIPSSKMLSYILEKLAEKMYPYKAYPVDADLTEVAEAVTRKHP